jgi:hypothetical protein
MKAGAAEALQIHHIWGDAPGFHKIIGSNAFLSIKLPPSVI